MATRVPDILRALQRAKAAGDTEAADYIRKGLIEAQRASDRAQYDPTRGMSTLEKVGAGFGKAFVDAGTGIQQLGAGVMDAVNPVSPTLSSLVTDKPVSRVDRLRQEVKDQRELDAPLMNSGAAKAGNFAGYAAMMLPAAAIPGANTVVGAGLIGAASGLIQPSASAQETALNTGLGGVTGAAGQLLGNKVAGWAEKKLTDRAAAAAEQEAANAARDAVLRKAQGQGLVVPPTAAKPSALNTALESISGKAAVRQVASGKNQKVFNNLIAEDLGLEPGKPITADALEAVRKKAGNTYKEVAATGDVKSDPQYFEDVLSLVKDSDNVGKNFPGAKVSAGDDIEKLADSLAQDKFSASSAIEYVKNLRKDGGANIASLDPDKKAMGRAQWEAAGVLEDQINRHLSSIGRDDLAGAFDSARTTIAKSYAAQNALKGGNVEANALVKQLRKGKPLSGGFRDVAEFADNFGEISKLPQSGQGVSKLMAAAGGASALLGHPALAAMAVTPYAVRNALLSRVGQRLMAVPNYAPGATGNATLNALKFAGQNPLLLAPASGNALVQPSR